MAGCEQCYSWRGKGFCLQLVIFVLMLRVPEQRFALPLDLLLVVLNYFKLFL